MERIRFEAKFIQDPSGCWIWTAARHKFGYGVHGLDNKAVLAHRRAWELYRGPIPAGLWVLHHCDVPACVNPDHLFVGTQTENNADMDRKGRRRHGVLAGEAHGRALVTEDQVRDIRRLSAEGVSYKTLAERYGLAKTSVSHIVKRVNWRHVA